MYKNIHEFFTNDQKAKAFARFRMGEKLSLQRTFVLILSAFFIDLPKAIILSFPTSIGIGMRGIYFKNLLKHCGKNCVFGLRLKMEYPSSISVSDYVWIDDSVTIATAFGYVNIGRRVHIAPYSIISGGGGVEIGDYVGIASFVQIYSHSEFPVNGLRMSGPMIPEEHKGFISAKVCILKDAFIGAGAIILPGVTVGEGAVVAANSVVSSDVPAWTIVRGSPAVAVGKRAPVKSMPDL